MSQRSESGSQAEGAPKRPVEYPPIGAGAAIFGVLIIATILAVPASFITMGKLEVNPWLILLFFFALLATVPLIAKTSKPLAAVYVLTSLFGTVALANSIFHVGYLEGGIGWALFMLFMYAGSRNADKMPANEHKPHYDNWDWDSAHNDEPLNDAPRTSLPGPIYVGPLSLDPEMGFMDNPFDPSLGYYDHHDRD